MKVFAPRVIACLLLLSGCASTATPKMFCPNVAVLQQAQSLTLFAPGRSDVGGEITTAAITGVAGACVLHPKKHLLDLNFQAGFSASNGPADNGAPVTLPYFVAMTQGNEILSKTSYTITLNFEGNATLAEAAAKNLKLTFPNGPESAQIQVLVGFELTPEQLAYNAAHPVQGP